ncbi:hypothetical protein SLS57_001954 [Botryosphaeria dothidea]
MQLTTLLLATGSLAAALPTTNPPTIDNTPVLIPTNITLAADNTIVTATTTTLEKRWAYKDVTFCMDANHRGQCATMKIRHALCYNMDRTWNDRVSSVYPARDFRCRLFANANCQGGWKDVGPNWSIANLKTIGWNDKMSSLDCFSQFR